MESESSKKCGNLTLSEFSQLNEDCPNELLLFIVNNRSDFILLLKEKDTDVDLMTSAIITLGKASNADSHHRKTLNKLLINLSFSMNHIVINFQRYLISLRKLQALEERHAEALFCLTVFLKFFQLTLPSSSLDSIAILLPLLDFTCDKMLKNQEFYTITTENLKVIKEEQKLFIEHHSFYHKEKLSEGEKLHLQEPPENFRSLSIMPTIDDIDMPCSFLRPNLVKGKYGDAEHYLDVQFRLLREDYIKPLRDGVAEYRQLKKDNKPYKNCKDVRVYCNVSIYSEEFLDGDLLHVLKFRDKHFSTIKWENSKRFLTGNLLCLSTDNFRTTLFATVILREIKNLKKGLLLVKFQEIDDKTLNFDSSINYVAIEVPTLFESYRHNLTVLQQLDENSLPMKNYIVNIDKKVNIPEHLQSKPIFDMRPMFFPIEEYFKLFQLKRTKFSKYSLEKKDLVRKYETVKITDESEWPTASELKLDESQYIALKSAMMKEFAIIQGPPGTGKTYIGLRIVQLILHNLDAWFNKESGFLPILIVCYTNHALDQFLEGISKLTKDIVRIGGGCSNENMTRFQIKNLVRHFKSNKPEYFPRKPFKTRKCMPAYITAKTNEARNKIKKIKEKILHLEENNFFQSSTEILDENKLKEFIPDIQYRYLMNSNDMNNKMYDWLEVNNFNDFESNINVNEEKDIVFSNDVEEKVFEVEDEVDIEFIENQRNIDYYDFDDRIVLRENLQSNKQDDITDENLQHRQKNNKLKRREYIRNSLENNPTMKEHRALKIINIWNLPVNERWQLYKFWLERFHEGTEQEYFKLQSNLKIAIAESSKARIEEDLWVLEGAQVVGMTTTGAAKYRHIIEARKPVVLVVEEAAEILESHIITSLTSETKHVILIGDQQQLRPSSTVYELAVKYGMDISLFERMIMNGMEYSRLSVQHRMRPEIAMLIVPHIYSDLKNHEVVTQFENIKGVSKSMFFISHSFDELHVKDTKSKVNEHEAKFIIGLCKYLINQSYEPSQITVLTTYSGQLFVLKKLALGDDDLDKIRFTIVDNFQGEENDIILISFVRSNLEGNIGFLKVSNRVCVALSRAKKGLYCIGNFTLLAQKSSLWKKILHTLSTNDFIGSSLRLICQNHPDVFNDVAKDSDFDAVPNGGCNRKCDYRLSCGHSCTLFCHPYDPHHKDFKCVKPCTKSCEKEHPCQKKCFKNCKPCPVMVEKILPKCGHKTFTFCGKNEGEIECREACKILCKKGHPCPKKCFETCDSCKVQIERTLALCGHTLTEECGKRDYEIKCLSPCKRTLSCFHRCKKKCHEPCERKCFESIEIQSPICGHSFIIECCFIKDPIKLAKKCPEPCKESLKCGHFCKGSCSACKQGNKHIICKETCQKLLNCGHLLNVKCYMSDNLTELSKRCANPCSKILPCGHTCRGNCGSCHQGRLHVLCNETCNRTLICGHKCEAKCYISCPPCKKPCKNRCVHKKCTNRCGDPCVRCVKPCTWFCSHKKCSRRCYEVCNRDPCNEKCLKKLPCNHPCVGFCGEPCPPICVMCDENASKENSTSVIEEENFGYVYLEDCKHVFKELDLRKWLMSSSSKLPETKLKTCPKCGAIIRMNLRFNKIIKNCISDVENVKKVVKYDKSMNLNIQRNLLNQLNTSHPNINYFYKSLIKVLSGGHVRDIYELTNVENVMKCASEIEQKSYGMHSMFPSTPFMETLIIYTRSCRKWIIDFIGEKFLSVSEYQLHQISIEVYRLSLLDFVLKIAKQKHFASLSPEFEKCASSLMNFKPLSDENIDYFTSQIKKFLVNVDNVPAKKSHPLEVVNMSAQWYQCSKRHVICFSNFCEVADRKDCYKCKKASDNETLLNIPPAETLDTFDVKKEDKKDLGAFNNSIRTSEFFKRHPPTARPGGTKTNTSAKHNSKFWRKVCSDTPHLEKSVNETLLNIPPAETLDTFDVKKANKKDLGAFNNAIRTSEFFKRHPPTARPVGAKTNTSTSAKHNSKYWRKVCSDMYLGKSVPPTEMLDTFDVKKTDEKDLGAFSNSIRTSEFFKRCPTARPVITKINTSASAKHNSKFLTKVCSDAPHSEKNSYKPSAPESKVNQNDIFSKETEEGIDKKFSSQTKTHKKSNSNRK